MIIRNLLSHSVRHPFKPRGTVHAPAGAPDNLDCKFVRDDNEANDKIAKSLEKEGKIEILKDYPALSKSSAPKKEAAQTEKAEPSEGKQLEEPDTETAGSSGEEAAPGPIGPDLSPPLGAKIEGEDDSTDRDRKTPAPVPKKTATKKTSSKSSKKK